MDVIQSSARIPSANIQSDSWLGEILGRPAYKLTGKSWAGREASDLVAAHIAGRREPTMYYAKIDTSDIASVRALSRCGFYVVDTNVTLRIPGGGSSTLPVPDSVVVEDADIESGAAAARIAGAAMHYSRFHLDPAVPVKLAHRIKYEWVDNYARRARGETLLIGRVNGEVRGFLAVLKTTDDGPVRTIDLIAVDSLSRRQGVGRALVASFINRYLASSSHLQVGTQVANLPSLALYQTLGFTIWQTAYVLHCHTPARTVPR
jgi:ribosomal protein S18 acetylase RimI-like enzyme